MALYQPALELRIGVLENLFANITVTVAQNQNIRVDYNSTDKSGRLTNVVLKVVPDLGQNQASYEAKINGLPIPWDEVFHAVLVTVYNHLGDVVEGGQNIKNSNSAIHD
ncbi:MAG: hypothetical protein JW731_05110 [Bacteroidales bacterium]|nr:hypothetical protein [Bacteroidales bacterium]